MIASPRSRLASASVGAACVAVTLPTLALTTASCDSGAAEVGFDRASRYGIFRDLVWFEWRDRHGGFFLDLFESTQEDWRCYRAALGERVEQTDAFLARWSMSGVDDALPVVGVDLDDARAFARWRFGRLPRWDEWKYAATAHHNYQLPWGNLARTEYSNSEELGYKSLTPVGMFESGRHADGPFDLIGNAGEWTETVEFDWSAYAALYVIDVELQRDPGIDGGLSRRLHAVASHPALAPWWNTVVPLPAFLATQVEPEGIARKVTGGAAEPMLGTDASHPVDPRRMLPTERGSLVGVRVATDADTLLDALLAQREAPSPSDEAVLRRFLDRNRSHLAAAWNARASRAHGPLAAILAAELGP